MHIVRFASAFALGLTALPALAEVRVADAWVRGTVQGQQATGAFMKLTSATDAALVAATSPAAKAVEIHQMKMEGATMRMRAVERVPLPAGKTVELAPGGYHVMLMGLPSPVKAGDVVAITLTVEDKAGKRTTIEVKAPVKPLADAAAAHRR